MTADPHGDDGSDLRARIVEIPDFPKPGILFRDLLPLLADPAAHAEVIRRLVAFAAEGSPLARRTNLGGTATTLAPNMGGRFLFSLLIGTQ